MANAGRDANRITSLIVQSAVLSTTLLNLTATPISGVNPLNVAVVDASGVQITAFGGGTQYTDGAARGTATGTLSMVDDGTNIQSLAGDTSGRVRVVGAAADAAAVAGNPVLMAGQSSGTTRMLATDTAGVLQVNLGNVAIGTFGNSDGNSAGLTSGLFMTENQYFNGSSWDRGRSIINATDTIGTGIGAIGILAQFDDTSPGTVTENRFGNIRMSVRREIYGQIRDAAGNERGLNITANNAAPVEGVGTAGSAAGGVISVQGVASMTAVKIAGNTASGSSISAAPVTVGGRAATANPTAVTDGQVVNATYDKLGKQVVVGSIRDLKVTQITTITTSTAETTVLTAAASTFHDVYAVICVNSSATATNVAFKDATAGTTRFNIYVPAGETRGFMLPESGAWPQATVNNNWTATSSASITSLIVSMLAVKNT